MRILIAGGTGLVGASLITKLFESGFDEVRILSRNKQRAENSIGFPVDVYEWDVEKQTVDSAAFNDVDVVINLAGEGVADKRWSSSQKNRILNSRVQATQLLVKEISKVEHNVKLISASAIGIYGDKASEALTENSPHGNDFLAEVCKKWEAAANDNSPKNLDTYIVRIGIVLSADGGALGKLLPLFTNGVAGPIGNGNHFMSWIHIDDLVNQFIFLIQNSPQDRIFNAVAPNPVTNSEFTKALSKVVRLPAILPTPKFILKIVFGEMSNVILFSQFVSSSNFSNTNFKFKYPNLIVAFEDLLKHESKGEKVISQYVWVNQPVGTVFKFFSSEKNLEKITPPSMKFRVVNKTTEHIEQGTLINYKLSVHGIPMKWKTLIKEFNKNSDFTDIQLNGPYSKWEHKHEFKPVKGGTLMSDKVVYKLPLGALGRIFAGKLVSNDVNTIFSFRTKFIKEYFNNELAAKDAT